jgi:hypothetical protein
MGLSIIGRGNGGGVIGGEEWGGEHFLEARGSLVAYYM